MSFRNKSENWTFPPSDQYLITKIYYTTFFVLREQTRTTNLLIHVGELGGCLECIWHQILIKKIKDDDDNWLNLQQCEFNITSGTGSCHYNRKHNCIL